MFKRVIRRSMLSILLVILLLSAGTAIAQHLIPVTTYVYDGKYVDAETMRVIMTERFETRGEKTTCVYVPSTDYSPLSVEPVQMYHCFDSRKEANAFLAQALEEYEPIIQQKYVEAFDKDPGHIL